RLEILTAEVKQRRERLEALREEEQSIRSDLAALTPLAGLPVRLDLLGDYETVDAMAVSLAPSESALPADLPIEEVAEARQRHKTVKFLIAERKYSEVLRAFLAQKKAEALPLPRQRPALTPDEQRRNLLQRLAEIEKESGCLHAELGKIAADNRLFICAAEETLLALLEKNRGAAYFAASEYALAGRFWVAESDLEEVKGAILRRFPEGVEIAAEEPPMPETEEKKEKYLPPTRLRNRGPVKPFEGLVEMLSVPNYHEIDPTWFLAICFPIFFGFIIGDLGYGLALAALGLYLRARLASANQQLADMLYCLTVGGASAALFGFLVFGDAFGIPFHPEAGSAFSWQEWLPFLPHPLIVKTSGRGVDEMLTLSFCAGWLHMGLGCLIGVWNARHHGLRHVLGRVGHLLMIMAMAMLVLALETFRLTATGDWLWRKPLAIVETLGTANTIAGLLLIGLALAVAGEGIKAAFEIFGLLSNVVSFSRLALVGVAKATLVTALNDFLIPALRENSWPIYVLLLIFLSSGHFALLLLGALSGTIQSLRLHYYETFSKFFEGNGKKFVAFGMERAYTDA
ncbi:MAG: hypothetical protein N3A66_00375, partial [Planctomycetota bacterium]|nr:hypothetical protein [Planctomycetota bacterium]